MRKANRIAGWVLALSIAGLLACEEHARRTWRDRAVEAEENLNQVRHFLALERAHIERLCSVEESKEAK